jgi:hypothetical protein
LVTGDSPASPPGIPAPDYFIRTKIICRNSLKQGISEGILLFFRAGGRGGLEGLSRLEDIVGQSRSHVNRYGCMPVRAAAQGNLFSRAMRNAVPERAGEFSRDDMFLSSSLCIFLYPALYVSLLSSCHLLDSLMPARCMHRRAAPDAEQGIRIR